MSCRAIFLPQVEVPAVFFHLLGNSESLVFLLEDGIEWLCLLGAGSGMKWP
jgi:hypothetical protein